MRVITSRQNSFYQQLRRLATSKRSEQLLLLEGVHLCQAWLTHFGLPQAVVVSEAGFEGPVIQELLKELKQIFKETQSSQPADSLQDNIQQIPFYCLATNLFNQLSGVVSPQGVLFLVERPTYHWPQKIEHTCVLLDRVQDPGNLGTILRTAAALNIRQVFLTTGTTNPWSAKVLRSAQGAHFHLAIYEHIDEQAWFDALQIPLAVTVLDGTHSLYQAPLKGPVAWAFGNESKGVALPYVDKAQHLLTIPHSSWVESLNVAVAAAVCLFEQHRQNLD